MEQILPKVREQRVQAIIDEATKASAADPNDDLLGSAQVTSALTDMERKREDKEGQARLRRAYDRLFGKE